MSISTSPRSVRVSLPATRNSSVCHGNPNASQSSRRRASVPLRRYEADGADALLPQALLLRHKQILLPATCGRITVMNVFETILPFLKPIEHLILDDSISEVMVNGPDRIFIEKAGFIEVVRGVSLGEKSLMVAVKNIARRLGDDISESKPILDSRLPDGSRVA